MSSRPTADEVRDILAILVERGLVHVGGAELGERTYFVDPLQLGRHLSASRISARWQGPEACNRRLKSCG